MTHIERLRNFNEIPRASGRYRMNSFYSNENDPNAANTNKLDIELAIQHQFQIQVPALIFEYTAPSADFTAWDFEDLNQFFNHFGHVELLEINGKVSVILFTSFNSANKAREFLLNEDNIKEKDRNCFTCRWYSHDDDYLVSEEFKTKTMNYAYNNISNYIDTKTNPIYNYFNPNYNSSSSTGANCSESYNYRDNIRTTTLPFDNMRVLLHQSYYPPTFDRSSYIRETTEDSAKSQKLNKFTCKYIIAVENDKSFQIARRLIGPKGGNMKRIIEESNKIDPKTESIKLRLRGQGSGYREGPNNLESEEPLHLCVSSKYQEKYESACSLVEDLLKTVYGQYRSFFNLDKDIPILKDDATNKE